MVPFLLTFSGTPTAGTVAKSPLIYTKDEFGDALAELVRRDDRRLTGWLLIPYGKDGRMFPMSPYARTAARWRVGASFPVEEENWDAFLGAARREFGMSWRGAFWHHMHFALALNRAFGCGMAVVDNDSRTVHAAAVSEDGTLVDMLGAFSAAQARARVARLRSVDEPVCVRMVTQREFSSITGECLRVARGFQSYFDELVGQLYAGVVPAAGRVPSPA